MRGMLRKVLADLRSRPLQTALLFGVIMLAAATLTIAFAIREQASSPYDRLMRQTNGAHAWIYSANLEGLETVAARPEVVGVSGPFPRTRGESSIEGNRAGVVSLWGVSAEPPAVARPLLQEGRWVSQPGEAVLEAGLARTSHLEPGDHLSITTGAGTRTFTVVGTALTSSRLPYPQYQPGVAYVMEDDVRFLAGGRPEWEVGLQLHDAGSVNAFLANAFDELGRGTSASTWQTLRSDAASDSEVAVILFAVFGAFATGAVALIIANAVGAAVLTQYREIGILKTIGFTPNQVAGVFIGAQVLLAAVGAITGSLVGFLVAPWLLADVASVLAAPRTPTFLPGVFALVVSATVVLVAALAWLPAWSGGRATPVRTIVGANRRGGLSRLAGAAGTFRVPPVVRLGVKDAFARPVRSWLTVGALGIAVATAAIALAIPATLDAGIEDPSLFSGELYDLVLVGIPEGELPAAGATVSANPDVANSTVEYHFAVAATPTERFTMVRAIAGDEFVPFLTSGEPPRQPGEVLLTKQLAARWDLGVGDTFEREISYFAAAGGLVGLGTRTFQVSGLYSDGDDHGATILTNTETFPEAERLGVSAVIGIKLRDQMESARVAEELKAALGAGYDIDDEASTTRADLQEVIDGATPVLSGLTAMLFVIALANVLTTLLFSVRERYRELGVLKAVGLTPGQVVASVSVSACLLGVIGVVIGIPAGLLINELLFDFFGSDAGWKPGVAVAPAWWKLAALLPVGLVVAVLGAYVPARRAARMSPTEALRFE